MNYTTLLLDLDHTLLDSDTSERLAYTTTLEAYGVADPDRHFPMYRSLNLELWAMVERGEISPNQVRSRRFERFCAAIGLDADPVEMGETFIVGLAEYGELYPGAREVLQRLNEQVVLALVTNGIGQVQRGRIARLDIGRYFDAIVISGEVGTAKPGTGIFDLVFDELGGPAKADSLMVGDSLTSDIRGGANYGIDTCWYNPHGKTAGGEDVISHEISTLENLPSLLHG